MREAVASSVAWFRENLQSPTVLSRSRRPRADQVAISWIKGSASDHVDHLRELVRLLEAAGVLVEELRTERPGYVGYEDDHQVAAEPFSDTGA